MSMGRDDNQSLATIDDRRHPMHQTRALRTAATRLARPVGHLPITASGRHRHRTTDPGAVDHEHEHDGN